MTKSKVAKATDVTDSELRDAFRVIYKGILTRAADQDYLYILFDNLTDALQIDMDK